MSWIEIVAIVALCGYAVYQQTKRTEVIGSERFRLAIIYIVVGLLMGGYRLSLVPMQIGLLLLGLALSVVVGVARGRLTRVWAEDGRVFSQGTALTIGLFLGLIAVKFALGFGVAMAGIDSDGGFGEVLAMIGVMLALQAELIWRRGRCLGARDSTEDEPVRQPAEA